MSRRPTWWLNVLKIYWPLNAITARATRIPILGKIINFIIQPLFSKKHFNITYLPMNKNIKGAESLILPRQILEKLIRESSHRVTINRCSCRDSMHCSTYPVEDSCLLLGEGTRHIDARIAKHISIETAIEHFHEKLRLGLFPMLGRVRMDDLYYGVPNEGKMLTICFCCTCCCTVLRSARSFPREISDSLVRLQGLTITVDHEKCKRCETCVNNCFMRAITLINGRINHDEGLCKGCGRCALVCPEGAVSMELENINSAIDEIYGRIRERIDIT